MKKMLLAAIMCLTLSGYALALTKGGAIEANALQSGCQDVIDSKDGYCTMYLQGYVDGVFAGGVLNVPYDFSINVTTLRHLYLAHMESNPADAKKAAWLVLSKTLIENTNVTYNGK